MLRGRRQERSPVHGAHSGKVEGVCEGIAVYVLWLSPLRWERGQDRPEVRSSLGTSRRG